MGLTFSREYDTIAAWLINVNQNLGENLTSCENGRTVYMTVLNTSDYIIVRFTLQLEIITNYEGVI